MVVCWCLSVLVLVLVGRCVACTPTHASVFATQSNMGCNCNAFNLSSKKLGMNKDDDSYNQNTAISHGMPGCRHAHTPSQLTQSRSRTRSLDNPCGKTRIVTFQLTSPRTTGCWSGPTDDANTSDGRSSPASPARVRPDPASTTSAGPANPAMVLNCRPSNCSP